MTSTFLIASLALFSFAGNFSEEMRLVRVANDQAECSSVCCEDPVCPSTACCDDEECEAADCK